jgi:AcrR family transcriptional regulator
MPEDEIFRTTLPPGRHKLPRDFVEQHQRARLFAAIVKLVNEQGYPATSLTQIVKTAGVARHTFYEHFDDKEALFLAVFESATGRAVTAMREATEAATGPWESRIRAGLAALLDEIAREPVLARVCLTEALSATPRALVLYEQTVHGFAAVLRGGRESTPPGVELPEALEDIVVGGVVWMLNKRLLSEEPDIEGMLPEVLEFVIAPYRGSAAAREVARPEASRENPAGGGG